MSVTRVLVIVLLAVLIGVLLIVLQDGYRVPSVENRNTAIQKSNEESIAGHARAESRPLSASMNQHPDCTPWSMIGHSPDAYLVDKWYATWGAPPSFSQELASRPYAQYSKSDLKLLAETGDTVAIHELGQVLIWSAFRDNERMPDVETMWELGGEKYPYGKQLDFDQLELGRDLLYRAAVTGRLYALIDISLSFVHQNSFERELGGLNDDELQILQIEAYAYGEAVERLVAGMPSDRIQITPPNRRIEVADRRLSEVIERFTADRVVAGLDSTSLPKVDHDLLESLNLCVK